MSHNLPVAIKKQLDAIEALEQKGAELLAPVELNLKEWFIGAMYVRQILIPKDTVITSRVYKRTYVDIMISGDITITDSNSTYRLQGYHMLEGTAGRKRAGFAHEDTLWVTVHDRVDIDTTDPLDAISFVSLSEYEDYRVVLAQQGYTTFLEKNQLTDAQVRQESDTDFVVVTGDFYLADSPIEGTGVFASKRFLSGDMIGLASKKNKKSTLGRYINHSVYPNAMMYDDKILAIQPIDAGHEIVINYEYTPRGSLCQAGS